MALFKESRVPLRKYIKSNRIRDVWCTLGCFSSIWGGSPLTAYGLWICSHFFVTGGEYRDHHLSDVFWFQSCHLQYKPLECQPAKSPCFEHVCLTMSLDLQCVCEMFKQKTLKRNKYCGLVACVQLANSLMIANIVWLQHVTIQKGVDLWTVYF